MPNGENGLFLSVEQGTDPRDSPGFNAPLGSLVTFGGALLKKSGPSPTNWTEVGGGGLTAINTAGAGLTIDNSDPTAPLISPDRNPQIFNESDAIAAGDTHAIIFRDGLDPPVELTLPSNPGVLVPGQYL